MAKKTDKTEDQIVALEEALGKTEQFIEKNQKILIIVITAIVIIVLGFYGYKKLYVAPQETEAQEQMFQAEAYFDVDSLNRALYGDGNNLGFIDIASEYGVTKAGNLANYYAGICFLKKGSFEEAIDYLDDFSLEGQIIAPMALGAKGDAYMEIGDIETAANYYLKAADYDINDFTTPLFLMKAAWTYELLEEYDKAIDALERIDKEYQRSPEARDVPKYIARVEAKASSN